MDDFLEQLKMHIKNIELKNVRDIYPILKDALIFLSDTNIQFLENNESEVASLFCRTVTEINSTNLNIAEYKDDLNKLIKDAFENINGIFDEGFINREIKEGKYLSEIQTIVFLKSLFTKYDNNEYDLEYTEKEENEYRNLVNNLEKISYIFSITDQENKEIFPISELLFVILNKDDLSQNLDTVENLQTICLALQIFEYNPNIKKKIEINNVLERKNITFIKYLINKAIKIGDSDWIENYKNNGTLVLYDANSKQILIRNKNINYFDDENIKNNYKIKKVELETNQQNQVIAYYVEYSLESFQIQDLSKVTIEELIQNKNNKKDIITLLKLIYDNKNYNIFYDKALFRDGNDSIIPTNPFAANDKYIIHRDNQSSEDVTRFNYFSNGLYEDKTIYQILIKYGLKKVIGCGINIVNLGMIMLLESIYHVGIDDLIQDYNNLTFNKLVENWLERCPEYSTYLNFFLGAYTTLLKYISDSNEFCTTKWENHYLFPYSLDIDGLLSKMEYNKKIKDLEIKSVKIIEDLANNGRYTINEVDGRPEKNYCDFKIELLSYELPISTVLNKEKLVFIDLEEKKVFLCDDNDVLYGQLRDKIREYNKNALSIESVNCNKISNDKIDKIETYMQCFKDAYKQVHGDIVPLSDIASYRVANHLCFLGVDEKKLDTWYEILNKHLIIKYDNVRNLGIGKDPNTLYVPKDRSRNQDTIKSIYEKYLGNYTARNKYDLFDPNISFDEKTAKYCLNGNIIQNVVLIFDLIQGGKGTIDKLVSYLDIKDPSRYVNTHDSDMVYVCKDRMPTNVAEMVNTNQCKVIIKSIFATESGKRNVEKYISDVIKKDLRYSKIDIEICDPIETIPPQYIWTEKMDSDAKDIYKGWFGGLTKNNSYAVIREFNQPFRNVMKNELLNITKIPSLFCRRPDR